MAAAEPVRRSSGKRTLATLLLASLAYSLMQMMVVPALPAIERDLGSAPGDVAWLLSGFLLSTAVATPVLGRLGDLYGKDRVLIAVLAIFAGGSALGAVATSLEMVIAARVIQGFGGATFPLAFGIARDTMPPRQVAVAVGLLSGSFGFGGAAGLVLSGAIVDHFSWQGIFWLGIVLPLAATVGIARTVPRSPVVARGVLDWFGAVLLAGGLLPMLYALSRVSEWGWRSPEVVGLTAAGVAVLAAWCWWELRQREPLIDVRLLARRPVWTVNAVGLFVGFGLYSTSYLVPRLVQGTPAVDGFGFGASTTAAGIFLLPAIVAGIAAGPLAGAAGERFGPRLPLLVGTALLAIGFLILAVAHDAPWQIYLATTVGYGVGVTICLTSLANLIIVSVPQSQTGESIGMSTMVRTVGGSIGSQVAAVLVVAGAHAGRGGGFPLAFAVCTAMAAAGFVVAIAVPRPRRMR